MSRTLSELEALYNQPFFDLITQARAVYCENWQKNDVQLCTLLSVKTGGCSEDCAYCAQSARYSTDVKASPLMRKEAILPVAQQAKENGSTRFCMGAAWKGVRDGDPRFDQMLDIIDSVKDLGMEVCVTLGQIGDVEAEKLKKAGVTAYNHNIDTSPEHYGNIVSTHTFSDRLNTIKSVQKAGMAVCCGGILGMGETIKDRLRMLEVLCSFDPLPESVPINCLSPIEGTPLANSNPVDVFDLVRLIATTRIALPKARVRLSAGRTELSREAQALCFYAGANAFFYGDKLLTVSNPDTNSDLALLEALNLSPQKPFSSTPA